MKNKHIISAILAMTILILSIYLLGKLTAPKYTGDIPEGAMINEYYSSNKDNDVIFLGDCEVFENISPMVLEESFGIKSWIRGSAQQLVWQSCYLLEETFRYENPEAVVFNVNALRYGKPVSEAYNRMTLDGMRFSGSKIKAVSASVMEEESVISYYIPLLRYHSRWSELGADDLRYMFRPYKVTYRGYLEHTGILPQDQLPTVPVIPYDELPDICMDYLDRMRMLCEENGAELVLVKSPVEWPHWYDEWDAQLKSYAEETGLCYINFVPLASDIGLDMKTDTYDGGLHLNKTGAEKYTKYLGEYLKGILE